MNKTLPITTDTVFNGPCHLAIRMAIIRAHEELTPWYVEHLNLYTVMSDFDSSIDYGYIFRADLGNLNYFEGALNFEDIPISQIANNKDDFENYVINSICHDKYVLIFCDYSYLMKEYVYNYCHEIVVYGYDSEKKLFDLMVLSKDKFYKIQKEGNCLFESFKSAILQFNDAAETYRNWLYMFDLPASTIKVVKNRDNIRLKRFYNDVRLNLEGRSCLDNETGRTIRYGVSGYKLFYNELIDKLKEADTCTSFLQDDISGKTYSILYRFRFLADIKSSFADKLKIINRQRSIFEDITIKKSEQVAAEMQRIFLLLTKYAYSKKAGLLNDIKNRLIIIETVDIELLAEVKSALFVALYM